MRTSCLGFALSAFILGSVHAALHSDGVCFDNIGGQNVYSEAATTAACASYLQRNTGGEQWDTCPDCAMVSPTREKRHFFEQADIFSESCWKPECMPFRCLAYWR